MLEESVNDVKVAQFDAIFLSLGLYRAGDAEIEAVNDAFKSGGQVQVGFGGRSHTEIDHVQLASFVLVRLEDVENGFERSVHVASQDHVEEGMGVIYRRLVLFFTPIVLTRESAECIYACLTPVT